jgi:hypothetical protein
VQMASRRAADLWNGRDAVNVGFGPSQQPKASSVYSGYAETVTGKGRFTDQAEDHKTICNACARVQHFLLV